MIAVLAALALATPGFDPTAPAATFPGTEASTQDGTIRLWSEIVRFSDPDRTLFTQEAFNGGITWRDTEWSPWIRTTFGTGTPHSSTFLLHVGPSESIASGTPVLMVPGAGDNGSRGFVTMATRLDRSGRPVYALTFAHPHGDVFQQAEIVADAIAVIRERTGAARVDVVAHSKGGMAAATYASHTDTADWGDAAYEAVGTPYRDDIRRLVLVATPLGGIDTAWRWPGSNLLSLDGDTAVAPVSWRTYYPNGPAVPATAQDLTDHDFLADTSDVFPGQRQLLARQSPALPGTRAWLMGYALQPDWYTTYEGGLGFVSRSSGIDAAISEGGDFVDRLAAQGVDPRVALFLLAGSNPLMPNGDAELADLFGDVASAAEWATLIAAIDGHGIDLTASTDELDGLASGEVVLGEVSAASDGVVFVQSALRTDGLTARGAVVVDTKTADLSHIDLLYASPITGALLVDAAGDAPENGWMRAFGARYASEDTLGWVEAVLADDPADPDDPEPDPGGDVGALRPCGSCATGTATAPWWAGLLLLVAGRRSRSSVSRGSSAVEPLGGRKSSRSSELHIRCVS